MQRTRIAVIAIDNFLDYVFFVDSGSFAFKYYNLESTKPWRFEELVQTLIDLALNRV